MASKFCPKCGNLISTSGFPNFCIYGCGSLKNEPIFPEFKNFEERQKLIQQAKEKNGLAGCPSVKNNPEVLQMKLF